MTNHPALRFGRSTLLLVSAGVAAAMLMQPASAQPPPGTRSGTVAASPVTAAPRAVTADAAEAAVADLMGDRRVPRAVAVERLRWQERAGDLQRQLPSQLGTRYGGTWIGAEDDRVKVGIAGGVARGPGRTGLQAEDEEQARDLAVEMGLDAGTDLVPVTRGLAELERASAWISTRLAGVNAGQGAVVAVAVAPQDNVVDLVVPPGAALSPAQSGLLRAAQARFGDAVRRTEGGPGQEEERGCTLVLCELPLRGGIEVNSIRNACTGGFVVRSRVDSTRYLLTAGHCLVTGESWYLNKVGGSFHYIGPVSAKISAPSGDAGIIRVSSASRTPSAPWIYLSANYKQNIVRNPAYAIKGLGRSVVGARICATGRISGTRCGKVTRVGYTSYLAGSAATVTSLCSKPGDSGGPLFSYSRGYGVVAGGWDSCTGSGTYGTTYTELSRSLDALRVNLVLAP